MNPGENASACMVFKPEKATDPVKLNAGCQNVQPVLAGRAVGNAAAYAPQNARRSVTREERLSPHVLFLTTRKSRTTSPASREVPQHRFTTGNDNAVIVEGIAAAE
jgi:hypothetical protein